MFSMQPTCIDDSFSNFSIVYTHTHTHYGVANVNNMLKQLRMSFKAQEHYGLDDSWDIARVSSDFRRLLLAVQQVYILYITGIHQSITLFQHAQT